MAKVEKKTTVEKEKQFVPKLSDVTMTVCGEKINLTGVTVSRKDGEYMIYRDNKLIYRVIPESFIAKF